jgi:hypothetical protein
LKNILLAAGLVVFVLVAARGVASLPQVMHGHAVGPLHTSEEVLFKTLNGDF